MSQASPTSDPAESHPLALPGAKRTARWPWQRIHGPFWNAANTVSLLRVPMALVAVAFYLTDHPWPAGILAVVSFATDAVDGAIARATNTITEWGKVLDPLSDKAVFALFGLVLMLQGKMPIWLWSLLVARDVFIVLGSHVVVGRKGEVPASNWMGKASTLLFAGWMIQQMFWPQPALALQLDVLGLAAFTMMVTSTIAYTWIHRGERT